MDESQVKKLKIGGLVLLIIAGLGYGAYATFGGGPEEPVVKPSPKVDELKQQYEKSEKPPENVPPPTAPPSRRARQVGS